MRAPSLTQFTLILFVFLISASDASNEENDDEPKPQQFTLAWAYGNQPKRKFQPSKRYHTPNPAQPTCVWVWRGIWKLNRTQPLKFYNLIFVLHSCIFSCCCFWHICELFDLIFAFYHSADSLLVARCMVFVLCVLSFQQWQYTLAWFRLAPLFYTNLACEL